MGGYASFSVCLERSATMAMTRTSESTPSLLMALELGERRWKLAADAPVTSCYEAGRDGFWLHRWLVAHGVVNVVVDSASIEVNQRAKRMKTDRLDLEGLLTLLAWYVAGDARAWRIVRVPTVAQEDARQWHRE